MPIHIPPINIAIDPCNDPNLNVPPVTGLSRTPPQAGVFGIHCAGGNGVQGTSASGVAVRGDSQSFLGVFGRSLKNDGIQGRSASPEHAGVSAVNETNGFGLYAESRGGLAGTFNGSVQVTGDITAHDVFVSGEDLAEDFDVGGTGNLESGTVMVLDTNGMLRQSEQIYDKRVVGVVSGAGDYKPGIILGKHKPQNNRVSLALLGKVYCKVDAQFSPIEVGDLLTTSSTPGHAMKVQDSQKAFGAVIGKALRPLPNGRGLLPILIALQ
jgi:hypothetical protein